MTCPHCKCPTCRKSELNAVLARRIVSCATETPRDLSFVELHNATILQTTRAKDEWRDTVGEVANG